MGLLVAGGLDHVVTRWDAAMGRAHDVAVAQLRLTRESPPIGPSLLHQAAVVLSLVWSGLCVWAARWMDRRVRQRRAATAVRARGGSVGYADCILPTRLRRRLGEDFCARVVSVSFDAAPVGDEALASLCGLPYLRCLRLAGTGISDAGLANLKRLKRLESLDLTGTNVTDRGLRSLGSLNRLARLWLTGTEVTQAGLQSIGHLPRLQSIEAAGRTSIGGGV